MFAPTNLAFKALGPRINAFLFSRAGVKYLNALLKYHVVPNRTLYSTAYYDGSKTTDLFAKSKDTKNTKRHVHLDLPTLLNDKPVAVDVIRRGPFVVMKVNAFSIVRYQDGLARDGVIQAVNRLVIPPKKPRGNAGMEDSDFGAEDEVLTVEELIQRLDPFIDEQERVSLPRLDL
jgi:uncharacterized surface protein with fasciclin (FAS1) repeats